LQIQNRIARLPGVADANTLGGLDFTMRIWIDPNKLAARELTAGDLVRAIREQNVQVAAGALGQEPATPGTEFQYTLTAQGRLAQAEQFGDIVLRTGANGDVIRVRDVARVELGARDYAVKSYMDGKNAISLRIFQLPGTNALDTAKAVYAEMARLKERFSCGSRLSHQLRSDTFRAAIVRVGLAHLARGDRSRGARGHSLPANMARFIIRLSPYPSR
jgi:multidrug efflux pump